MANDPEYDALYAAVCAAPEDDTPRLVLTDWLDEHDDPHRAAYIRAQIGLEREREADPHAAALFHFHGTPLHHDWNSYVDPALVSPAVARMCALVKQCVAHGKPAAARWKAVLEKRKSGTIGFGRGFPASVHISNAKQYAQKQPPENLPGYSLAVS